MHWGQAFSFTSSLTFVRIITPIFSMVSDSDVTKWIRPWLWLFCHDLDTYVIGWLSGCQERPPRPPACQTHRLVCWRWRTSFVRLHQRSQIAVTGKDYPAAGKVSNRKNLQQMCDHSRRHQGPACCCDVQSEPRKPHKLRENLRRLRIGEVGLFTL